MGEPEDGRRRVEQRGLWFDELEVGVVYVHRPGRTVTEADNTLFTTLTMNTQALHLDEAWSATQPFGQRLVNSLFTLSTLVGLSVAQLTQGTTVANLGFSDVSFPAPVFHGDTLYAETVVRDKRLSRTRAGQGVVTLEHTARNQHGAVVAVAVRSALMLCSPTPPGGAASVAASAESPAEVASMSGPGRVSGPGPVSVPGPALLFCPADRPDRFAKAAAAADGVILDLEDGVAAADRPRARQALRETLLDPARTIVRINPAGTDDHAEDLATLADTPYTLVMLAKAESAEQVAALTPRRVLALCETPIGMLAAAGIAAVGNTAGIMWGAEDLVAALGGRSSRDAHGRYRGVARQARATALLAAGAYGRVAVDSVYLDIKDRDGLAEECRDAAASGFGAKACIHPSQVAVVRAAFAPSPEEVDWARRVLDTAAHSAGVFSFEGRMVDAPVLRHAERTLANAIPTRPT